MTCWKLFIVVFLLFVVSESKWVRLSGPFSKLKEHNGWLYLQKFTFEPGYAKFDIETFVRGKGKSKSHDLYIQGIPSEKWQKEQQLKCENPVTMPLLIQQMRMTGQKDRDILQFTVNEKRNTYYFVIKDCYQMFRRDYDNDNLTFHIHLRPYSNDVEIDDQPFEDTPSVLDEPQEEFIVTENQQEQVEQEESSEQAQQQTQTLESLTATEPASQSVNQQSSKQKVGQTIQPQAPRSEQL